jgi:hypothetical protein
MKRKKIRVRQHRRKKRSGGSSVVRSHLRAIKKKKKMRATDIEIIPGAFEDVVIFPSDITEPIEIKKIRRKDKIKRKIPPFVISNLKTLTKDNTSWYAGIDYEDFLKTIKTSFSLIEGIYAKRDRFDLFIDKPFQLADSEVLGHISSEQVHPFPLANDLKLLTLAPLIRIAKDHIGNYHLTISYIKDEKKFNRFLSGVSKYKYENLWNQAIIQADEEFKEKFQDDDSVNVNENSRSIGFETIGVNHFIFTTTPSYKLMEKTSPIYKKTRKEFNKIMKKKLKKVLAENGIEFKNFSFPYEVETIIDPDRE